MTNLEKIVSNALITYQREEIAKRYTAENLSNLGFKVSEKEGDFIKHIFLGQLYPDVEKREKMMDEINSLKSFASTKNLGKTIKNILELTKGRNISEWKNGLKKGLTYGIYLPALIQVGLQAASIHGLTKKIDDELKDYALKNLDIGENFSFNELSYEMAYLSVERLSREKVIRDVQVLFGQFKKRNLMAVAESLINDVIITLEKNKEEYKHELNGIKYINGFINEAVPFFSKKTDKEIEQYIRIIGKVEKDYSDGFYRSGKT